MVVSFRPCGATPNILDFLLFPRRIHWSGQGFVWKPRSLQVSRRLTMDVLLNCFQQNRTDLSDNMSHHTLRPSVSNPPEIFVCCELGRSSTSKVVRLECRLCSVGFFSEHWGEICLCLSVPFFFFFFAGNQRDTALEDSPILTNTHLHAVSRFFFILRTFDGELQNWLPFYFPSKTQKSLLVLSKE